MATKHGYDWICSTLLVPLEKSVPPLQLRAISFRTIFSAHRYSVSRCINLTKAIWIMMLCLNIKSGGSLILGMQEETQAFRKTTEQI